MHENDIFYRSTYDVVENFPDGDCNKHLRLFASKELAQQYVIDFYKFSESVKMNLELKKTFHTEEDLTSPEDIPLDHLAWKMEMTYQDSDTWILYDKRNNYEFEMKIVYRLIETEL
jgi:hypothetical protein